MFRSFEVKLKSKFTTRGMISHSKLSIFPFLDGDVPLAPSYGVYIFLNLFGMPVSAVIFRILMIAISVSPKKLLSQGFRYNKLIKTFTKFFHKYKPLASKYRCTCHNLIKNGISYPTFYGNVVNKARKFKLDPSHLNKLIRRGYRHNIVVRSLNIVFIGTNIDFLTNSLLVD